MQTTLRINDEIFRRAKSMAAHEGITLTKFIEEALFLRIGNAVETEAGEPETGQKTDEDEAGKSLVSRLELLFELADERDRLKEGSAGPFHREELYAERLDRFR